MSEDRQLQVTPASLWKRKTYVEKLPSGMVAELKKPDTITLALRDGRMPEGLSKIILEGISGKTKVAPSEWKPKNTGEIAELIDMICHASFVRPAIVDNPDYDHDQIAITDVEEIDKMWVMNWAQDGGGQLLAAGRSPDEPDGSVPPP